MYREGPCVKIDLMAQSVPRKTLWSSLLRNLACGEPGDGADGARPAELLFTGLVKGSCAVEL